MKKGEEIDFPSPGSLPRRPRQQAQCFANTQVKPGYRFLELLTMKFHKAFDVLDIATKFLPFSDFPKIYILSPACSPEK